MLLLYHVLQWFKGCALNLDNSNKTIVKRGIGATSLKARGDGIFSPYIRPIRDFWICVWAQNPCGNLNVFHLSLGFLMLAAFSDLGARIPQFDPTGKGWSKPAALWLYAPIGYRTVIVDGRRTAIPDK